MKYGSFLSKLAHVQFWLVEGAQNLILLQSHNNMLGQVASNLPC